MAWFRPAAPTGASDTTALIDVLAPHCDIDVVDARRAHEFVWKHDRRPYDLPVFELTNSAAASFIWPYLLRYPGLLVARTRSFHDSRAGSLRRQGRRDDYRAELDFSGTAMLRAPLLASRLVVVAAAAHAQALQEQYPDVRIRVAPLAVPHPIFQSPKPRAQGELVRFGMLGRDRVEVVRRAVQRARDAGARADLLIDESDDAPSDAVLRDADVILALLWSRVDEWPEAALAGMAAGRPVVVLETEATADWPAWDPQTWRPRDPVAAATPAVISLDPRDEEHSLMLAIRRLASDAPWREALATAGHAWWQAHGSPEAVADAWLALIHEAMAAPPPPEPPGWPAHLRADGSRTARDVLGQLGVETDIFE